MINIFFPSNNDKNEIFIASSSKGQNVKASGEIDEEYRDSKIEEINAETRNIEAEITANTSGLEDFEYKTRNERVAYDEMSRLTKEYFALKQEIEDIEAIEKLLSDKVQRKIEFKVPQKRKNKRRRYGKCA